MTIRTLSQSQQTDQKINYSFTDTDITIQTFGFPGCFLTSFWNHKFTLKRFWIEGSGSGP